MNLSEISPEYLKVLIALEDKRYWFHPGIDPFAITRAIKQDFLSGSIVSGASTITMQLARDLHPKQRTLFAKILDMWRALRLSVWHGKKEILTQYVNRVCYGANCYGIEAAARYYLGVSAANLTVSQSALLASIPQNPTLYNPLGTGAKGWRERHATILRRLLSAGVIDTAEYRRSLRTRPSISAHPEAMKAPQFTQWILSQRNENDSAELRTTLDLPLQEAAEDIVRRGVAGEKINYLSNAAAVVLDNASGAILAYVGSNDWNDAEHQGQVDGVRALRSAGSTLKPFVYAQALLRGFTAATVIADIDAAIPTPGGYFFPRNYDCDFHGPVRLREALGCSYNIPAVRTAHAIGVENLLTFLHRAGYSELSRRASDYGPGLALGNGEVSLLHQASAYAMLARRGIPVEAYGIVRDSSGQATMESAPPAGGYTELSGVPAEGFPNSSGVPAGGYTELSGVPAEGFPNSSGSRPQTGNPSFGRAPEKLRVGKGPQIAGESSAFSSSKGTRIKPILPQNVSAIIEDILSDADARGRAFGTHSVLSLPFRCAVKTGTSKDYRDNWCIGFTDRYTVAVWAGNFDGSSMRGVSGVSGAGPIFHEIMLALDRQMGPAARFRPLPPNLSRAAVCPLSGLQPGKYCGSGISELFRPGSEPQEICSWHEKNGVHLPDVYRTWASDHDIVLAKGNVTGSDDEIRTLKFECPENGAIFQIDPETPMIYQTIPIRVLAPGGLEKVSFQIDGKPAGVDTERPFSFDWQLKPGRHTLAVKALGFEEKSLEVLVLK